MQDLILKRKAGLLLLVITIIMFGFFALFNQAKAQCRDGFAATSVNIRVNGCLYHVDICLKCSVGPSPSIVYVRGYQPIDEFPPCVQTLSATEVLQYIESQISNYDFLHAYLCAPRQAQGCNEVADPSTFITVYHWVCWKIQCIEYFGQIYLYYTPCDYDNYCEEIIWWCIDAYGIKHPNTMAFTMHGTVNCTKEVWEVHIPTVPGTESECYKYHTICNP